MINYRYFFFSNRCSQSYKFPSRHCFHCIPQILISSFISLISKILKFSWDLFFDVLFKSPHNLGFFSLYSLIPSLITLWSEKTLNDLYSSKIFKCVLWPRTCSRLVILRRICTLVLLVDVFYWCLNWCWLLNSAMSSLILWLLCLSILDIPWTFNYDSIFIFSLCNSVISSSHYLALCW